MYQMRPSDGSCIDIQYLTFKIRFLNSLWNVPKPPEKLTCLFANLVVLIAFAMIFILTFQNRLCRCIIHVILRLHYVQHLNCINFLLFAIFTTLPIFFYFSWMTFKISAVGVGSKVQYDRITFYVINFKYFKAAN